MFRKFFSLAVLFFLLTGCGGGSSSSSSGSGAVLSFEVLSTASTTTAPSANLAKNNLSKSTVYGQATSAQVTGMEYYIYDISICKSMTINGTGYSGQSGCISVYSADHDYDYDTFVAEDAANETEHYINLMDSNDLATLSKTVYLTSDDIGEYYYGKVDHYRPIKVTASVTLNDDTALYTKTGTSTLLSGSGIDATYVYEVSDITEGPAEESIVVLSNGGSWFKFEKPLTITSDDVANETTFQMKLAFNMDNVVKGYQGTSSSYAIQDATSNYSIAVPIMAFTPVVYRSTETANKESYLLRYTNSGSSTDYASFDFRMELYAVAEDTDDSIYAADTLRILLQDDDVGEAVTQIYRPYTVEASSDSTPTYSFYNWLEEAFLTGFTRGTEVGDTSTATYVLDDGNTITMDVILNSIDTIEADSTIDTISAVDLNGIWTGICTTSDSGSYKNTYSFDRGTYTLTRVNYSDGDCATVLETIVTTYQITLADKTTATGGEEVKEINMTYSSVTQTPATGARATALNDETYCSYADWAEGEEQNLLGQDICLDLDVGDIIYDIYRTSGGLLYFGNTSASTEANRPTTLGASVATYTSPVS